MRMEEAQDSERTRILPLVAKVTATAPTSPPTIPPTTPAIAILLSILKQFFLLLLKWYNSSNGYFLSNSAMETFLFCCFQSLTVVLTSVLLKQWIERVRRQNWFLYTGFFHAHPGIVSSSFILTASIPDISNTQKTYNFHMLSNLRIC